MRVLNWYGKDRLYCVTFCLNYGNESLTSKPIKTFENLTQSEIKRKKNNGE